MNGFVFSGSMVPGMSSGNQYNNDLSFDGGDPGLNYRFSSVPEDNENNYTDMQELNDEENFTLFPCRKSCKEKLGGKGPGFRDCLRECRGKGPRKSKQAQTDAELQAKMIDALSQGGSTERAASGGGAKTVLWIVLGVVVLIGIGVGIYFLARKKAE